MRVFISWSGERSHAVAEELKVWIKKNIQTANCWVSSDMERGVKWQAEVNASLDTHSLGILCVTPENVDAPWLNFEAGALSRHFNDEVRVMPYLLDFDSAGDLTGPLNQFNASVADEDGTWQVITTLNNHSEVKLTEEELRETFDLRWPQLLPKLDQIKATVTSAPTTTRPVEDKVDEVLTIVRELSRSQTFARVVNPGDTVAFTVPFATQGPQSGPGFQYPQGPQGAQGYQGGWVVTGTPGSPGPGGATMRPTTFISTDDIAGANVIISTIIARELEYLGLFSGQITGSMTQPGLIALAGTEDIHTSVTIAVQEKLAGTFPGVRFISTPNRRHDWAAAEGLGQASSRPMTRDEVEVEKLHDQHDDNA